MINKRSARKHKYERDENLPKTLRAVQLGAWRIIYVEDSFNFLRKGIDWLDILSFRPLLDLASWRQMILRSYILRFCMDVWQLGPVLVLLYTLFTLVKGTQDALELHCSDRLFKAVSVLLIMW